MSEQQTPEPVKTITPPANDKSNELSQQQLETPDQEQLIKEVSKDTVSTNESSQKEKLGIYKALAIKLKKELLRTREELNKLKQDYSVEVKQLQEQVDTLSKTLESERVIRTNTTATLEATIRNLRNQLEVAESELLSLQKDFDNYKTRATKLLQQANPAQSNLNKAFEEERFKQLKNLNEEQTGRLNSLRKHLEEVTAEKDKLKDEFKTLSQKLEAAGCRVASLEASNEVLSSENENLKTTIEQMDIKAKGRHWHEKSNKKHDQTVEDIETTEPSVDLEADDDDTVLEDANTNSNSSVDSSTCGYVHIKPTTFEIISRSSVLEDAQNQIDHLTKAYLDSENTNSLLSEQVEVLKEEIRRIQRGNDRMELVNNLEYLKNILFKFLSLDSSQIEQRQRLVPVLSTVLKLSPDEASKLNSLATSDKTSVTSSIFKL